MKMQSAKSVPKIKTMNEWKQRRDTLRKQMVHSGYGFRQFVIQSILFFYDLDGGNHNKDIINSLLSMAFLSRGVEHARLAAYLEKAIPHELHKGKHYTGSNKDKVLKRGKYRTTYYFGGKLKGAVYNPEGVMAFLEKHPDWSTYGKEMKSTDYTTTATNLVKRLKSMETKLTKEGMENAARVFKQAAAAIDLKLDEAFAKDRESSKNGVVQA